MTRYAGVAVAALCLAISTSARADWHYEFTVPKGAHAVFDQSRPSENSPAGWSLRAIISDDVGFQCTLGDGKGGSNPHFGASIDKDHDHVWTVRFFSEKSGSVPSGQPTNVVTPDWEKLTGSTVNQAGGTQVVKITSIPRLALNATKDLHVLVVTITGVVTMPAIVAGSEDVIIPFPNQIPSSCVSKRF